MKTIAQPMPTGRQAANAEYRMNSRASGAALVFTVAFVLCPPEVHPEPQQWRAIMIHEKSFYRLFWRLAGTLILEQAVILSVNLADNVMIGSYSETALAGVAAVNMIQFVVQQIVYGLNNGMIVLSSQYWGQKRLEPIRALSAIGLLLEILFAVGMFVLATLCPQWLVRLFVDDEAIIAEGVRYLRIIRFTYLFFAMTTILLGAMRSVETVRLALVVSSVSLVVNCSMNFLLIPGRFGLPELGVRGAAIGTLTARILEFVLVCVYVFRFDKKLRLRLGDMLHLDRTLLKDFLRVDYPILVQAVIWGVSNAMQTAFLGHMAASAMTAYSISSTVFLLLKVTSVGACTAASILVGKQIGQGDGARLRSMVRTMQVMFLCIGLCLAAALFIIRLPLLSMYQISDETYQLASTFILIQCVVLFTMSYQMPVNAGILRGGGDTRYGMILDLISIWGIVLPVSYLAAFNWNWPPVAVVICLNADQVFKCVPAAIRVNRFHWINNLTRKDSAAPQRAR